MLTVRSTINVAGQAVPNIIPAVQGDTGRSIEFTLADFTIPTGSTATYYVQKPSGEAVYNAATINDNKVTVELTAQSLAETGDNYGQVRILNGEDVVTSFDFILLVKPFRGIDAVESTTEMNIFDEAVQNAMANIDGMLPNIIAPVFDTSTAYTAGDYVIYSGKLYQFTASHSGAWTGSDAEETTVSEDITALKEDLSASTVYGLSDIFKLIDKWIRDNGTIGDSDTDNVGYIPCKANTRYAVRVGAGDQVKVSYATAVPVVNAQTYGLQVSTSEAEITTGSDALYLTFQYQKTSSVTVLELTDGYQFAIKKNTKALDFKNAVRIYANDDLNNYTAPGNYYIATGANAASISNLPPRMSALAGRLTVETLNNVNAILQRYDVTSKASGGCISANRLFSGGAWTDWQYDISNEYIEAFTDLLPFDRGVTEIPSNADLNNYKTPGNFYIASGAIAQTVTNLPTDMRGFAGRLTVKTLNNTQAIKQRYEITSVSQNRCIAAIRLYSSGVWGDWIYETTNGYVARYSDLLAFDRGAESIPANSDLNTYKTPGNFYIASGAIAQTVSNVPYAVSGSLTVKTINHTQSILQEYTTTSVIGDGNIKAYRLFSGGAWGEWIKPYTKILADRNNRDAIVLYDKMAIAGASEAINVIRHSLPYDIKFANATAPLWLVNYAGNTQNCHPKVLYFENGFGNHKYWMAYTPYPYCNDDYENPCIAYSDDGYHFINITGNPLDDPHGVGYNSDTHLAYNTSTQKLEVWWRYVNDDAPQETIYRMTTSNGTSWSAKEIVYNNTSGTQTNFESPCVIYESGMYKIWVCTYQSGIRYYEAPENDIANWTLVRSLPFTIQDEGINVIPWHIDVIKDDGKYIMAIMCRHGASLANNICSVFLAVSSDNVTYDTPYKVISGNVGIWDKVLYRTCIVKTSSGYRLYYTGETGGIDTIYGDARWGLGISESDNLTNFYGVCKDTRVN